jgi:hypothetical protein
MWRTHHQVDELWQMNHPYDEPEEPPTTTRRWLHQQRATIVEKKTWSQRKGNMRSFGMLKIRNFEGLHNKEEKGSLYKVRNLG